VFSLFKHLPNPHDPFRSPARRWLRCQYLLQHGRPHSCLDDRQTWTAFRFLWAYQRCRDDAARGRLARHHPALAEAHAFFSSATPLARAEVEARLLAGQDDRGIADRCRLSAAAVMWFHDIFYDVRPCLHARYHITNVVIGPKAHADLTEDDPDVLLKLFGYEYGPAAVDDLVRFFQRPPVVPARLDEMGFLELQELHHLLRIKAAILARRLPLQSSGRNKVLLLAGDGAEPGCDPGDTAESATVVFVAVPSPEQGLLHLPDIVETIELEKCG
jgi:hypothetical protein